MFNCNISRLQPNSNNYIMLHSADIKLTENHIDFWLESLLNTTISFSILVRDIKNFKKLTQKYPSLQILYAKSPIDVESVITAQPSLKAILYTSNLARNIHLLRFNHLKHIFIGTKNSEWLSQFNKSYRAYDEIWCGGEFVINRMKKEIGNIGHLEFKTIGKPQLLPIVLNKKEEEKHLFILMKKYSYFLEKIYFATQNIDMEYYLSIHEEKKLKNFFINTFKVKNKTHKLHIIQQNILLKEFIHKASLIITDKKSLSPYSLQYQVPIILMIEKEEEKYFIEPKELRESCYFVTTHNELKKQIIQLETIDNLKEIRDYTLNYFFHQNATLKQQFKKELQEICK